MLKSQTDTGRALAGEIARTKMKIERARTEEEHLIFVYGSSSQHDPVSRRLKLLTPWP
jgi:hypothetical protein